MHAVRRGSPVLRRALASRPLAFRHHAPQGLGFSHSPPALSRPSIIEPAPLNGLRARLSRTIRATFYVWPLHTWPLHTWPLQFLRMTSAVTMSVMGNTKLVVLIGLSMLTLERAPSLVAVAGVGVALMGVFWYTAHRHLEHRHKEAAAAREKEVQMGRRQEAAAARNNAEAMMGSGSRAGEGTSLLGGGGGAAAAGGSKQPRSSTC